MHVVGSRLVQLGVRFGLAAAVACAAVGTLGSGPALADAAAPSSHRASIDAQAGPVIAAGSVLDNGRSVARASVTPVVWPNDDILSALPTGAVVPVLTMPPVTTYVRGYFTVPLSTALRAKYLDGQGRPNVELRVVADGKATSLSFTADPTNATNAMGAAGSTGWTTTMGQAAAADGAGADAAGPETMVVDLGTSTSTELTGSPASALRARTLAPADASSAASPDDSGAIAVVTAPDSADPAPCVESAGAWFHNRVEPFAHVYPGKTAPATVKQAYGVDHTIGIAALGGAKWIGGHAGGHKTISLAASGSKTLTSNSTVFNSINLRQFHNVCTGDRRQAMSVYSILSRIDSASEPDFTECTTYGPGFTLNKKQGTNITFGSEVNVGSISVDAQSGWNSSTEITWQTGGTRNTLCGSTRDGWASAPEAEANSAS